MKKTFLDLEIDKQWERLSRFAKTDAYDWGVRDVYLEGYICGLEKAKRLVRKQNKVEGIKRI